jgi:hypothetical protein
VKRAESGLISLAATASFARCDDLFVIGMCRYCSKQRNQCNCDLEHFTIPTRPSGGYRHRTDASESRDYHGPQIDGWEALLLEIN